MQTVCRKFLTFCPGGRSNAGACGRWGVSRAAGGAQAMVRAGAAGGGRAPRWRAPGAPAQCAARSRSRSPPSWRRPRAGPAAPMPRQPRGAAQRPAVGLEPGPERCRTPRDAITGAGAPGRARPRRDGRVARCAQRGGAQSRCCWRRAGCQRSPAPRGVGPGQRLRRPRCGRAWCGRAGRLGAFTAAVASAGGAEAC